MRSAPMFLVLASVLAVPACAQPTGPVPATGAVALDTDWSPSIMVGELRHPWAITWLPGGNDGKGGGGGGGASGSLPMLITERGRGEFAPRMLHVSADFQQVEPVEGLPNDILPVGQGGLMDVAAHPDFAKNRLVYFTYSSGTRSNNFTRLSRAKLTGSPGSFKLEAVQELYSVDQSKSGGQHFGSRILFLPDGTLLLTIGDGGNPPTKLGDANIRDQAQNKASALGKVLRLTDEGKPAAGNPFADDKAAKAEVFSLGHRNIQGIARDPASGRIYVNEHGARGGDELNLVEAGKNYGWPLVTYSTEYWGPRISEQTAGEGYVDPLVVWTPAQAPSGLVLYTGDRYPAWKGNLFSGGLISQEVRRITLDKDGKPTGQTALRIGQRVRDVRQGPDGLLYVLTDDDTHGRLIRIDRK